MQVHHCDRVKVTHEEDFREVAVPWRREGKFLLLPVTMDFMRTNGTTQKQEKSSKVLQ